MDPLFILKILMGLLSASAIFIVAGIIQSDGRAHFYKFYRILQKDNWYYVQYRVWWWPFWSSYSHYTSYDKPREVTKYGGLFSDIGYPGTEYGYSTELANSLSEAKGWMKTLKLDHIDDTRRSKKKRKEKSIRKVHKC